MYELIWRALPGNWFSKLILSLGLIAGVCYLLMQFVFPVVAPYMPFNDATIEEEGDHAPADPGEGGEPGVEQPGQGG